MQAIARAVNPTKNSNENAIVKPTQRYFKRVDKRVEGADSQPRETKIYQDIPKRPIS